jgi:hypothetical protein
MTTKNKQLEAIDLLIEDIHTPHNVIRMQAKKLGCDSELTVWQDFVLEYLQNLRRTISGESNL